MVVEIVPENRRGFDWKGLEEAVLLAVKKMHGDFGVGATTAGFNGKPSIYTIYIIWTYDVEEEWNV